VQVSKTAHRDHHEVGLPKPDTALLESGNGVEHGIEPLILSGYIPDGTPFSNPSTLSALTPLLPSTPDCTVRPQTIIEIQRMRAQSHRIAQLIDQEVVIMGKRKAYVEQMTAFLNDRIKELNMVKEQLKDELQWIEVSQNKIQELAEREKLVKLQDILTCLNQDSKNMAGDTAMKSQTISTLNTQADTIKKKIDTIKAAITSAGNPATTTTTTTTGATPASPTG